MTKEFNANTTEYYLDVLRRGFWKEGEYDPVNGTFHNGVAVLEFDWIDIELNIFAESGDHDGYTNKVGASYFCCVKGIDDNGNSQWSEAGYLDDFGFDVEVNWDADDWEEQLEADMERKLEAFAWKFYLKYASPNWRGTANEFAVFDSINGIGDRNV